MEPSDVWMLRVALSASELRVASHTEVRTLPFLFLPSSPVLSYI